MQTAEKFFIEERKITPDTLEKWGVKDVDGWLHLPYPEGTKARFHDPDGKRHFRSEKGTAFSIFGEHMMKNYDTIFLVEGESDALRLWQELRAAEVEADVIALPGINTWKDKYAEYLVGKEAYVVIDNDADYKAAASGDKTWRQIRKAVGHGVRRIYLPEDVKDVCEFFDKYNLDTLRALANRGKAGVWHYQAMDLDKPAPPPDWLIDELVCKGDLTMMIGEPGVGKSWISMSLAVAVAEGWKSFLGRDLKHEGRVLYVDEENPEALVLHRLKKLGLSDQGSKNIRYLHRQGVRLDRYPDLLLDEALDWEPTLIVLDSLTRLHTKDENNAGEVAGLFNDGINPLARETGATTLILHHVNKSESNSSFTRTRGSGDLSASIDSGLDVRDSDTHGGINIVHYKSRWIQEGTLIRASIEDTPDGHVAIIVNNKSMF